MENETLPLRDRLMIELGWCSIMAYSTSKTADAILPLIEAEREAAAKAALEAAARIVAPTMNKRGPFAMTVSSAILAIDPAQFRSDRDGQ